MLKVTDKKNGTVPEGYQLTSIGIIPLDWDLISLEMIVDEITQTAGTAMYETVSISAGIGFVNQAKKFGKELSGNQYERYIVLHKGDFSYNKGNSQKYPQGCIYRLTDRETAAVPNVFESFRIKDGVADYFEQLFISGFLNRQLFAKINHGVRDNGLLNLTGKDFYSCKVPFPSIKEQKKIAEILIQYDKIIELCKCKLEKVIKLKKACMDKMFPKQEKTIPEIRFPGFSGSWEQRKLLSCIEKITDFRGRTPKKLGMDWSNEGYLALSALNVKDGYIDFSQDVHYGNQELYDKWMTGNELHKGQVLFTTEAPMGNVAQIPDNRRYILSQRTIAFDVKQEIITEDFFAVALRTPEIFAKLTALSSGGTAKGVSQKSLVTVEVMLPSDPMEQEKLAKLFLHFDHLITLYQRELEEMEKMKKALMQQLLTGRMRVKI